VSAIPRIRSAGNTMLLVSHRVFQVLPSFYKKEADHPSGNLPLFAAERTWSLVIGIVPIPVDPPRSLKPHPCGFALRFSGRSLISSPSFLRQKKMENHSFEQFSVFLRRKGLEPSRSCDH
jgi:hypothetical protein